MYISRKIILYCPLRPCWTIYSYNASNKNIMIYYTNIFFFFLSNFKIYIAYKIEKHQQHIFNHTSFETVLYLWCEAGKNSCCRKLEPIGAIHSRPDNVRRTRRTNIFFCFLNQRVWKIRRSNNIRLYSIIFLLPPPRGCTAPARRPFARTRPAPPRYTVLGDTGVRTLAGKNRRPRGRARAVGKIVSTNRSVPFTRSILNAIIINEYWFVGSNNIILLHLYAYRPDCDRT